MAELITGPSGGVLGDGLGVIDQATFENHPDVARQIVTLGKHRRAGHDRERWASVDWDEYRAQVGCQGSAGPWSITPVESVADGPTEWVCETEGLPFAAGWHTALMHAERGLVMSDVPAEIAGALPFLDCVAGWSAPRVLVAGLGLGIVPAWLLTRTQVTRLDVVEIDPDVISLITGGRELDIAPNAWAADPRLHVHQGDAHLWYPGPASRRGCCLHDDCTLWANSTWQAGFFDVWDTVSPANLPSMHRLTRRFARRVYSMWSWERAECEAMRRRGQTLARPGVDADGNWRFCNADPGGDS